MLVSQLSKSIANGIEYKDVLKKVYDNRCSISESKTEGKITLTKVDVINLPIKDVWIFRSEI